MARKSNKTSHVLNLLTKGNPASEKESTAKVTIVDESANDVLSENVLERLEAEFAEPEKNAEEEASVAEEPIVEEKIPVIEKPAEEEKTPVIEEPVPMEKEIAVADMVVPVEKKETVIKEKSARFFNIMEELLERQNIEKYMEQYGVCSCPKCAADVKARTLTNLPAKYVSSEGDFAEPAMNFYENKYKIRILTELIRSCIAVRNNPRHDNS